MSAPAGVQHLSGGTVGPHAWYAITLFIKCVFMILVLRSGQNEKKITIFWFFGCFSEELIYNRKSGLGRFFSDEKIFFDFEKNIFR